MFLIQNIIFESGSTPSIISFFKRRQSRLFERIQLMEYSTERDPELWVKLHEVP